MVEQGEPFAEPRGDRAPRRLDLAADRADLRADCSRCVGLCCAALPFARSADFAYDKPAGEPCVHLRADFRCGIHARLRDEGFRGCAVFDCFGAGQKVSQVTFAGADWREEPGTARRMFSVLGVMRRLHELLWYLAEALALPEAAPVAGELTSLRDEVEAATRGGAGELEALDVTAYHRAADPLLLRASELARAHVAGRQERRGADLAGAHLQGADLAGASLRGASLIAADLRGADLRRADLLGADLRDADLRGADLTDALFVTQPQLESARGEGATRLPPGLDRPAHWA